MAQKSGDVIKGGDIFRAFVDLVILTLLVCGAAFGGYYWGLHERLAPVQNVPPGTPGALPAAAVAPAPAALTPNPAAPTPAATPAVTTAPAAVETAAPKSRVKYWLTSSGADYMGYSITVSVNDNTVDSFFGPGKSIDVTRFVKPGENEVVFEAKALGDKYNRHKNDARSELKVQVVSGPKITDEFKPSDVLLTYKRNASEAEDFNDTLRFKAGN